MLLAGIVFIGYPIIVHTPHWIEFVLMGTAFLVASFFVPPRVRKVETGGTLGKNALVVVSLVFSLMLCELGARLVVSKLEVGGDIYFEPDPSVIWTLVPGASGECRLTLDDGSTGAFPFSISSQGLRDREYGPKSPDEFRIAVVGDSYVFGRGVADDETIPKRLEAVLLDKPLTKRVSVINAGCGGYGPWQEHLFLAERGFPLEPDLVIFQILLLNDIADTMIREGQVPEAYEHLNSLYKVMSMRYFDDWKVRADLDLQRWSRAYKFAFLRTDGWFSVARALNELRPFHDAALLDLPENASRPWLIETNLREWYPELDAGWDAVQADVLAMRDDCRGREIDFIAFALSGSASLDDDIWRHVTSQGGGPNAYERHKDVRLAHEFFDSAGIPFVPVPDCVARHPDPKPLFFQMDGHFTPAGTRVVAERIADYLMTSYFPDRGLASR